MKVVINLFIFCATVFFCCESFSMGSNWFRMYSRYASTIRNARVAKSEQLKKIVDEEDDKIKSTQSKPRRSYIFFQQKSDATPSFRERMNAWWQSLFTPKKN